MYEMKMRAQCILKSVCDSKTAFRDVKNLLETIDNTVLPVITPVLTEWVQALLNVDNIKMFPPCPYIPLRSLLTSTTLPVPLGDTSPISRSAQPTKDPNQFPEPTEKLEKKNLTNSMIPIKELLQDRRFPHREQATDHDLAAFPHLLFGDRCEEKRRSLKEKKKKSFPFYVSM